MAVRRFIRARDRWSYTFRSASRGGNCPNETSVVDVAQLLPGLVARSRDEVSPEVAEALLLVEQADLLLVGTPVYKGSYTGLFKHFIDLLDYKALNSVVVGLLATGGSDRHALVIEHQLRPLFGFFNAHTLPTGVFVPDGAFIDGRIRILPSSAVSLPLPMRLLPPCRHVPLRSAVKPRDRDAFPLSGVVHDEIDLKSLCRSRGHATIGPVGLEHRSQALLATALLSSGAQAQTRVLFGTAGSWGCVPRRPRRDRTRILRKLGLRQRS